MQNPQNMAMMAMNPTGGPVGGTPQMNNNRIPNDNDSRAQLNTYIYDYFLRNNYTTVAKAMLDHDIKVNLQGPKPSPSGRNEMNGMDNGPDSKDSLPPPRLPEQANDNSFLLDWWQQFWDIYAAARTKGPGPKTPAHQYLATTRVGLISMLKGYSTDESPRPSPKCVIQTPMPLE
jgi:hypothetical protein